MRRPSAFKTDGARAKYCRLYDEGIATTGARRGDRRRNILRHDTCAHRRGLSKPPLVALHGLMISSTMWLPILPALTRTHQVRMLDAVGDLNKDEHIAWAHPHPSRGLTI